MAQIQRRKTYTARIGEVKVGSDAPIVVQSMTNTDTADIDGTIRQVHGAGPRRFGAGARHRQQ